MTNQPGDTTSTTAPTTTAPTTTTSEPSTTTTQVFTDPADVIAEYIRTYGEGDNLGFRATVTRNYRYVAGGAQITVDDQARNVGNLEGLNGTLVPIGEVTTTGTGPYEVEFEHRITADNYGPDGRVGTSILTVVDDGGTLEVSRHVYRGESL